MEVKNILGWIFRSFLALVILFLVVLALQFYGIPNFKFFLSTYFESAFMIGFAFSVFYIADKVVYHKIDFMEELRNGNIAVGIFTACLFLGTILSLAMMYVRKY